MEITRPTIMEIDVACFRKNIEEIKKKLKPGTKIMPVIKAGAYGTYLQTRIDILNQFDIVAVATVDEGEKIRSLGFLKDILVLNQPDLAEIEKIIQNDLSIGMSSEEFIQGLKRTSAKIKVHIEVETGMGRTGVFQDAVMEYIQKLPENVIVEGIYTHFSSADQDEEYTRSQIQCFDQVVKKVASKMKLKYIHSQASSGILNFEDSCCNYVRPGILLYGYPSCKQALEKIKLYPVAKLKSKITFLKTVPAGSSISYARTYITKQETKVATVPVGYADGLRRCLSNQGEVLIHGKKVPIIGTICMDSFMVDVSQLEDVQVGDEVFIWDNDKITLEEIAKECHTINYEILSTISYRVPRKFVNDIEGKT